jgi:hypothetical protein
MIMLRNILAIWIFLSSLIAVAATAIVVRTTLAAYPPDFLRSFGPHVPATSEMYAGLLLHATTFLGGSSVTLLIILALVYRRSSEPNVRNFYMTLFSAINFCFALFAALTLLVGYFMLPKLANPGLL